MSGIPEFTISEPSPCFLVEITKKGCGLVWRKVGRTPEEAIAKAKVFIDGELQRYHKSEAAKHARASGRRTQALSRHTANSEAEGA